MDQAGPSYAPSDPLPGTFFGLSLDITFGEVVRFSTRHSRCYGTTGVARQL